MKKHLIHLKDHGNTKFAVAEIEADIRPGNDLELFEAVQDVGGAYVTEFQGYTYTLDAPAWVPAEEFEHNWLGD